MAPSMARREMQIRPGRRRHVDNEGLRSSVPAKTKPAAACRSRPALGNGNGRAKSGDTRQAMKATAASVLRRTPPSSKRHLSAVMEAPQKSLIPTRRLRLISSSSRRCASPMCRHDEAIVGKAGAYRRGIRRRAMIPSARIEACAHEITSTDLVRRNARRP